MNKRKLGSFALCAMLLAFCASAEAQQPKEVPQVASYSIGPVGRIVAADALSHIQVFRKTKTQSG